MLRYHTSWSSYQCLWVVRRAFSEIFFSWTHLWVHTAKVHIIIQLNTQWHVHLYRLRIRRINSNSNFGGIIYYDIAIVIIQYGQRNNRKSCVCVCVCVCTCICVNVCVCGGSQISWYCSRRHRCDGMLWTSSTRQAERLCSRMWCVPLLRELTTMQ